MNIPYDSLPWVFVVPASLQCSCVVQTTTVQTNRSEENSIYSIANLYI
jgi:hypothetical protein